MDDFKYEQARDIDVSVIDRLSDVRRERSHLDSIIQPIAFFVARRWLRWVHRFEIVGTNNLPNAGPYLLVANHTSHLDTPALIGALPKSALKSAFPVAAKDTFFTGPFRSLLATKLVNALPVRRATADRQALATLRARMVEDRAVLIVYPEGTRGKGDAIAPFQPGVGMLVAGTRVPVVPCRLRGCEQALPKGRCLPRPCKIELAIGRPMIFENHEQCRATWQQIACELQAAVETL